MCLDVRCKLRPFGSRFPSILLTAAPPLAADKTEGDRAVSLFLATPFQAMGKFRGRTTLVSASCVSVKEWILPQSLNTVHGRRFRKRPVGLIGPLFFSALSVA